MIIEKSNERSISSPYVKIRYAWLTVPVADFINKNISMDRFQYYLNLEEKGQIFISGSYLEY